MLLILIFCFTTILHLRGGANDLVTTCRSSSRIAAPDWNLTTCMRVLRRTNFLLPDSCKKTSLDMMRDYRISNLLVTGVARSGTTFTSKMSQLLNFSLSNDNQKPTEFGMVAWKLATHVSPADFHSNGVRYKFRNIIHIVRDPLDTIRSLRTEFAYWKWHPQGRSLALKVVPRVVMDDFQLQPNKEIKEEDYILFGMRVWVEWNALIEQNPLATLIRVETICEPESLSLFFEFADCTNIQQRRADLLSLVRACEGHTKKYGNWNSRQIEGNEAKCEKKGSHCYSSVTKLTWAKLTSIDAGYAKSAYRMATRYGYVYNSSVVPPEWL